MRLPHAPLEHHCRRPGRDASTNNNAQSGAAHSRTRPASGPLNRSTASRAIVASIASTGRAATQTSSLPVVSCGARGARAAQRLSSSRPPGRGSTPGRASRLIASRSTRPAASCRPETRGGSRSMPVPTIQRARSSGSSSRSNDRRQRSPTVATKSRHSRPLFQWKRSSSGGRSWTIATPIVTGITHVATQCKSSQPDDGEDADQGRLRAALPEAEPGECERVGVAHLLERSLGEAKCVADRGQRDVTVTIATFNTTVNYATRTRIRTAVERV